MSARRISAPRTPPGEDPRYFGFDVNIAGHAAGGPGSYWGEKNFSAAWRTGGRELIWDVPGLEKYHGQDVNLTEALTREAITEMEKSVSADQPFYLYLSHYAVHAPWEEDRRFYQRYRDAGLKPFEARLASMIESMDHSLGDLMDACKRLGITDNTIVLSQFDPQRSVEADPPSRRSPPGTLQSGRRSGRAQRPRRAGTRQAFRTRPRPNQPAAGNARADAAGPRHQAPAAIRRGSIREGRAGDRRSESHRPAFQSGTKPAIPRRGAGEAVARGLHGPTPSPTAAAARIAIRGGWRQEADKLGIETVDPTNLSDSDPRWRVVS